MQKVLTAAQMREVDRLTTERYGIPSILLMENAAHAVARVITEKLGGSVEGKSILVLCGKGNNGGDGAALARILWTMGADCFVYLFGNVAETRGDAKTNFDVLRTIYDSPDTNGPNENCLILFENAEDGSVHFEPKDVVVVDALFGTGIDRPVTGVFEKLIRRENLYFRRRTRLHISVDLPSGLNSDTGEPIGENAKADVTVSFTSPKPANILPPAASSNGELVIANIGSPEELIDEQPSMLYLAEQGDAKKWLKASAFATSSYKNKRGHALIIAGSESFSGAAVLAGNAAMRSGVGLVTVVTPKSSKESIATRVLPEVMVRGAAETDGGAISEEAFDEIQDLLKKADAIAIGSGLSQSESTRKFIQKVIENRTTPVVIDADALNLLSPFRDAALQKPARSTGIAHDDFPLILTPHEGEFMRLLGTDDKGVLNDRVAAVREFSQKNNVILVLKGERVLIGEPGGKVVVNPTGNSGLGKAGNGDTLTGILGGFVTQAAAMTIDIFEAVVAAVYVAGMAGDVAEKKFGKRVMTASDVRECLVDVFASLTSEK
ncbi:MAG: NAD(P)H-hydrate dehydratase [Acidobacteriota bacterium]